MAGIPFVGTRFAAPPIFALALITFASAPAGAGTLPPPGCLGQPADIVGTEGPDEITGTAKADVIVTGGGSDQVSGAGGDDRICTQGDVDEVHGGAGNDRIDGGDDPDPLFGDAGEDILIGGSGVDHLEGGGDDDQLLGGTDDDGIYGGGGDDELIGGPGTTAAATTLQGDAGADLIRGGDGSDDASGGTGDDRMILAGDGDFAEGGAGADFVNAGDGVDAVQAGPSDDEVRGGPAPDTLFGEGGDDELTGAAGNDTVDGGGQVDYLAGGADDDRLRGGPATDRMFGNDGEDHCSGGAGRDACDGGAPTPSNRDDDPDVCTKDVEATRSCREPGMPGRWNGAASGTIGYGGLTETFSATYLLEGDADPALAFYSGEGTMEWSISGTADGCTYGASATRPVAVELVIMGGEYEHSLGGGEFLGMQVPYSCADGRNGTVSWRPFANGCAGPETGPHPYRPEMTALNGSRNYTETGNFDFCQGPFQVDWQWSLDQ